MSRYDRQIVYLGMKNQKILEKSKVAIVGCGAMGSVVSEVLTRSGLGFLTIVDRDYVETTNLSCSIGYGESDIGKPKALALAEKLKRINSKCRVDFFINNLNQKNIKLLRNFDLIIDCTDNMETRYVINGFCVKNRIPWIYSGVLSSEGMFAGFNPAENNPCFACLFPKKPYGLGTCESDGLILSAVGSLGSLVAFEAIKILVGIKKDFNELYYFNLENTRIEKSKINKNLDCPVCIKREFEVKTTKSYVITLCNRDVYQIDPKNKKSLDLERFFGKISKNSAYKATLFPKLLHIKYKNYTVSIFENYRAIIKNAKSAKEAKLLYHKILETI